MPIQIIDNINLQSDIPLDLRYTAETYYDVSAYWYPGMQVFQYSDKQIWFYNGEIWQNMTSIQSSSPGFDILNGGSEWNDTEVDIFDAYSPTADILVGGSY